MRDGLLQSIASLELVPGDLVYLEAGDVIAADGRIIESHELRTDEEALTGESEPVSKTNAPLPDAFLVVADRKNSAYRGTTVVGGRGKMVITETGMETQLGRIASLVEVVPEKDTSLETQLKRSGYLLMGVAVAIAALIFILGSVQGLTSMPLLLTTVSLIIAAIPEGLPVIITVALARAVKKMAKRNALIRRLKSVETLGCISCRCLGVRSS